MTETSANCPHCCLPARGPGLAFTDGTICNEPTHAGSVVATRWHCELCGTSATITYPVNASVEELVNVIARSHAEQTPSCTTTNVSRIRVAPGDLLAAAHPEEPND